MWTDEDKIKVKILFFSPNEEGTSYFTDSLIYICDHNEQGSLGLIFNRPLELDLKELLRGLKIKEVDNAKGNVFLGGPVNPGAIFILHSSDKCWKGTLKVSEHVYMSTDFEAIEDIAKAGHNALQTLGIDHVHTVIGPSMGGMTALAYALLFPSSLTNLIVISAAARALPFTISIRSLQRE